MGKYIINKSFHTLFGVYFPGVFAATTAFLPGRMPWEETTMPFCPGRMPWEETFLPIRPGRMPWEETFLPIRPGRMPWEETFLPFRPGRMPSEETFLSFRPGRIPWAGTLLPLSPEQKGKNTFQYACIVNTSGNINHKQNPTSTVVHLVKTVQNQI